MTVEQANHPRRQGGGDYFDRSSGDRTHSSPEHDVAALKELVQSSPTEALAAIERIADRAHAPRQEWLDVLEAAGTLLARMEGGPAERLILKILQADYRYPHLQQSLAAEIGRRYAQKDDARAERLLNAAAEHLPRRGERGALITLVNVLCREAARASERSVAERADRKLWLLLEKGGDTLGVQLVDVVTCKRLAASRVLQNQFRTALEGGASDALGGAMIRALPLLAAEPWVRPLLSRLAAEGGSREIRTAAQEALAAAGKV